MTAVTPARLRLAMLTLALGGFGIGCTEFIGMGLLPQIARSVLPDLHAGDQEGAISRAGWVITAYAIGVVVGAPTIAAGAARWPRKRLLAAVTGGFVIASIASALAPTFALLVAARFVAGLGHGAYFGVAALVASRLLGPERRGLAAALVFSGLTTASVVGVPAMTYLGQHVGWRWAYAAVAAVFALTVLAIVSFLPDEQGDRHATMRRELRAFTRPAVWFALLTGATGFGGFFAVYSYVAPLATEVTGTSESFVPVALVLIGLGSTVGILGGGRLADAGAVRAIFILFALFALSLTFLGLTAHTLWGMLIGVFLVGASAQAIAPAIQTRLMDVAEESQTIAAAVNHSALNMGNSLGAFLGGAAIAAGWGFVAPTWIGLALVVPGVVFALAGWRVTRSRADAVAVTP